MGNRGESEDGAVGRRYYRPLAEAVRYGVGCVRGMCVRSNVGARVETNTPGARRSSRPGSSAGLVVRLPVAGCLRSLPLPLPLPLKGIARGKNVGAAASQLLASK